jgi:hypothetical protein
VEHGYDATAGKIAVQDMGRATIATVQTTKMGRKMQNMNFMALGEWQGPLQSSSCACGTLR